MSRGLISITSRSRGEYLKAHLSPRRRTRPNPPPSNPSQDRLSNARRNSLPLIPRSRGPLVLVVLSFLAIHLVWGSTYSPSDSPVRSIPHSLPRSPPVHRGFLLCFGASSGRAPHLDNGAPAPSIGVFFFLIDTATRTGAERASRPACAQSSSPASRSGFVLASAAAERKWRMNATLFGGARPRSSASLLFQGETFALRPRRIVRRRPRIAREPFPGRRHV